MKEDSGKDEDGWWQVCVIFVVPSDAALLKIENHPRRMPLLPKAEGRSAHRKYSRVLRNADECFCCTSERR